MQEAGVLGRVRPGLVDGTEVDELHYVNTEELLLGDLVDDALLASYKYPIYMTNEVFLIPCSAIIGNN